MSTIAHLRLHVSSTRVRLRHGCKEQTEAAQDIKQTRIFTFLLYIMKSQDMKLECYKKWHVDIYEWAKSFRIH